MNGDELATYEKNLRIGKYMCMIFEIGMILSIFAMLKPLAVTFAASFIVIRAYQIFINIRISGKLSDDEKKELYKPHDDFEENANIGAEIISNKYQYVKLLLTLEVITQHVLSVVTILWIGLLPIIFAALDLLFILLIGITALKTYFDITKGRF